MSSHPLTHTLKWHLSPPFQQNCCKVTCDLPVAPFNDHFTVLISFDPPGPYTAYLPFSFLARLASLRCWVSALSQFPPTSLVSASQYSLLIPPQILNSQTLSAPWLSPRDVSSLLLCWSESSLYQLLPDLHLQLRPIPWHLDLYIWAPDQQSSLGYLTGISALISTQKKLLIFSQTCFSLKLNLNNTS